MTPTSVTLSSVGTSPVIQLDPYSDRPTIFGVAGSSSGTFTYTLQVSLDLSTAASITWINDSTLVAQTSNAVIVYNASPCQARVNVTALSSAVVQFKAVQGLAG